MTHSRGRPKKVKDSVAEPSPVTEPTAKKTEKETLLELYEVLKARNIRSISDLEGQIARAE